MGRIVRAGLDAARLGHLHVSLGIAQVARRGLGLGNPLALFRIVGQRLIDLVVLVVHHPDVSVRAIVGAQAASDAVVFDDDLLMLAAVDGVDRAADHAVGVLAAST